MITIERCRKILGKKAENMTDSNISDLLSELYLLGEIVIQKVKNDHKQNNLMIK